MSLSLYYSHMRTRLGHYVTNILSLKKEIVKYKKQLEKMYKPTAQNFFASIY